MATITRPFALGRNGLKKIVHSVAPNAQIKLVMPRKINPRMSPKMQEILQISLPCPKEGSRQERKQMADRQALAVQHALMHDGGVFFHCHRVDLHSVKKADDVQSGKKGDIVVTNEAVGVALLIPDAQHYLKNIGEYKKDLPDEACVKYFAPAPLAKNRIDPVAHHVPPAPKLASFKPESHVERVRHSEGCGLWASR